MRLIEPLTDAEREAFVAACRALLTANAGKAVPYGHRGRGWKVDCIGVPIIGLAAVGRTVEDERRYSPRPDGHTLKEVLTRHLGDPIATASRTPDRALLEGLQPADIVLMRWNQPNGLRLHCHVGVVTDAARYEGGERLCLLHAWADNHEVVEHGIGTPWDRRIVEVYRP
jgi:hypothetical protein